MKLILQSNSWDCVPTSFAMTLDVLPKEIYEYIGHDGSEILWPELEEPYRRRSFHIEEMIDFCVTMTYMPVMISRIPESLPIVTVADGNNVFHPYGRKSIDRFNRYLDSFNAVLLGCTKSGKPHAVAWSCLEKKIFDPEGFKYDRNEFDAEAAVLIA